MAGAAVPRRSRPCLAAVARVEARPAAAWAAAPIPDIADALRSAAAAHEALGLPVGGGALLETLLRAEVDEARADAVRVGDLSRLSILLLLSRVEAIV